MRIKETIDVSFSGSVETPAVEDVVVLADGAGVALGVRRAFSARVRSARDCDSGVIASKCVEIPLVGSDGEVSGVLCHTHARTDTRGAVAAGRRDTVRAIADVAQVVVLDINNLLAVIVLRLLERQEDPVYREAIVRKMPQAAPLVRFFLPRAQAAGLPSGVVSTEIAYTPSPDGGVFHVVNPATAAPTS
jgi:hypothetical protein